MGVLKRKINIAWSGHFAYAIGLLTSDGNLSADKRHISFVSTDLQLVTNIKQALSLGNKIARRRRIGNKKEYFAIQFGDKIFYHFLNTIGLWQAKSKSIQQVYIPNEYFSNFLRGLFDGDGTFYTFRDTRWPNSFGYQVSFASASFVFIQWLQKRLHALCAVKGFIRKGDGVFNLRYVKGDSRKLFSVMYAGDDILFLERKYYKMKTAFQMEQEIKKKAGLAHR